VSIGEAAAPCQQWPPVKIAIVDYTEARPSFLGPPTRALHRSEFRMSYNRRSKLITQGVARSPNRAMLRAVGFGDGDFDKPIVGVANGHSTMNPCNAGIQPLVDRAMAALKGSGRNAAGVRRADRHRRHRHGHRGHEVLARLA
jgi:hypothetical protein